MPKIIQGDCLEKLKELEANTIDLIVTDPPYGYSFMGKDWDKVIIPTPYWAECLRVLKAGAVCFVMSAPRQDVLSRAITNLQDAGFDTGFTSIYWTYASGFPKASNISKMVDKRNGRDQETYKPFADYLKQQRKKKELSMSAIDKTLGTNTAYSWWEGRAAGIQIPTKEFYLKLKQILELDNRFDELIERVEAEREVIGKGTSTLVHDRGMDGNFDGNLNPKEYNITKSATQQAIALDGSYGGFQPKPAVEVIIVAMKPCTEKTYTDQALANRKGITWLQDCRIPYESEGDKYSYPKGGQGKHANPMDWEKEANRNTPQYSNTQGRFPANLLVSDDVLNDGRERKSGDMQGIQGGFGNSDIYGDSEKAEAISYGDSGSFSRYFDLDKWAERTFPFLIVPKASKSEKNKGLEGFEEKPRAEVDKMMGDTNMLTGSGNPRTTKLKNNHPTVKPIKLMSYLITLGSRKGDTILDPFCGSGTTLITAKLLSRNYIGIELSPEYIKIAEARLKAVPENLNKWQRGQ